jgi:hypothetical protein
VIAGLKMGEKVVSARMMFEHLLLFKKAGPKN